MKNNYKHLSKLQNKIKNRNVQNPQQQIKLKCISVDKNKQILSKNHKNEFQNGFS